MPVVRPLLLRLGQRDVLLFLLLRLRRQVFSGNLQLEFKQALVNRAEMPHGQRLVVDENERERLRVFIAGQQVDLAAAGVAEQAVPLPLGSGASEHRRGHAQRIDAAGQRAGTRRFIPVAAQALLIRAVPEGGQLKPGVENVVFIMTAYPSGQPAQATTRSK
mgnify:CR=1 FL=1